MSYTTVIFSHIKQCYHCCNCLQM